jgi:hypothetical protein
MHPTKVQRSNIERARVIPSREDGEGSRAGRAVTEGNWRDRKLREVPRFARDDCANSIPHHHAR